MGVNSSILITDGGIETDLIFNKGVDLPLFCAFTLNDSPEGREIIRAYYLEYLRVAKAAGREFLFSTDTWRANSDWADQLGYDRVRLIQNNRAAVDLCAELAELFAAEGVASSITGIIGPRRDAWIYDANMTVGEAYDYHSLQMEAFAGTRATSVQAATLNNTAEAIGVARAARRDGLPIALSFTVETDGALPGGKSLGQAMEEVDEATDGYVDFYMVNCAHPRHFRTQLLGGHSWLGRIGGLRANASTRSHAELDESHELDIGDIDAFATDHLELMAALPNLRLLGGCCGTDHRHIAALCERCL